MIASICRHPYLKELTVLTKVLNTLSMIEAWYENDPQARVRASFPFNAGTGTAAVSMVYFELEPCDRLPVHTDSAEEIVGVLAGTVEVSLGDEQGTLGAGGALPVPALVPHGIRNIGLDRSRCTGFFGAPGVEWCSTM